MRISEVNLLVELKKLKKSNKIITYSPVSMSVLIKICRFFVDGKSHGAVAGDIVILNVS